MNQIVKNPIHLSQDPLEKFSQLFREDKYMVISQLPTKENIPESLIPSSRDEKIYKGIMKDNNASFKVFSLLFENILEAPIQIPIGVYGYSNTEGVRFPLLLNGFWQMFLMSDRVAFANICDIQGEEEAIIYYNELIKLKKSFSIKVFDHYKNLDNSMKSVMAWNIRGKSSNTRKVAEFLDFHRSENQSLELYASEELTTEEQIFMKNCVVRWGILIDGSLQQESNEVYEMADVKNLIRGMVNYGAVITEIESD